MSMTVNVSDMREMYQSFLDIYPELRAMCNGFRTFTWNDRVRKLMISMVNIDVKILFSVRKSDENGTWDQFSALLIPAPEKPTVPDPDKNAEVELSEDM